jgi:hypothetical protein
LPSRQRSTLTRKMTSSEPSELSTASSIAEYFHQVLVSALRNQGVSTSHERTEHYLVNLLEAYAHGQVDDEALALRLAHAMEVPPAERAALLRELADRALFVSGFFPDSIPGRKSLVDVDYYISMGENAYAMLERLASRTGRSANAPVYGELSAKFTSFVDVLNEVSTQSRIRSDRDLLKLYERWVRTGSSWVARQLTTLGVVPARRLATS